MNKPDNYAEFYGLLRLLPGEQEQEDLKKQLVKQYTKGRTESLREMTMEEYRRAVSGMQKIALPSTRQKLQKLLKIKRSDVLHQMQLYGIDTTDWDIVDKFCANPRIAGKVFRKLDFDDLDALYIKLRVIRKKQNKQ